MTDAGRADDLMLASTQQDSMTRRGSSGGVPTDFDAVVVGAGFAGLYALYRLRGLGLSVRVFEAGDGVGGTWFWNRYPGARVDIESQEYSYSFSEELEREWQWSERYATQPELLRYLNHVADRFDLRRDIQLETRVASAVFDEAGNFWTLRTEAGAQVTARFCIMATGCLSQPKQPDIPGIDGFAGQTYFTSNWPHEEIDFTGQSVGVIGTGSSGIQVIPQIARQAKRLYVFQRTPNYSLPAQNRPRDESVTRDWLANREAYRQQQRTSSYGSLLVVGDQKSALEVSALEREATYVDCWNRGSIALFGAYSDLLTNAEANGTASEFVRSKIRGIVEDPEVAAALVPTDHPILTKRPCVDIGYFETFNRDNVTLVDIAASPLETITPDGLRTADGDYAVDSIVMAIGFDAVTGALTAIDIRGRDGIGLADKWTEGPRNYLGLTTAGFPNLFMITGPGSPAVLSVVVVSIEQHVDWIADCIVHLVDRGFTVIEPTQEAESQWVAHVNDVANATLFPSTNSWYLGANVPGKPRVFLPYAGGVGAYRAKCDEVAARGYEGFIMSGSVEQAVGSSADGTAAPRSSEAAE